MNYSPYQNNIFNFITHGSGNAVVEAVAGSGKTTTIVTALNFIDPTERVLFAAFNKHIADELQRRVPANVTASTLNSIGWKVCRRNMPRVKLEAWKNENLLRNYLNGPDDKAVFYKLKNFISRMVGLGKALMVPDGDFAIRFESIASKYGIEIPDVKNHDVKDLTTYVWLDSIKPTSIMDYDDQIYQPVRQNWSMFEGSVDAYNWVFGDEVQDWSPVQIELIKRLGAKGRIIAVGDRRQSIYGFRGADPDAIPNIIKSLDAEVLPLSICYRCPNSVIEAAKEIVPHIEAPENNPKGDGVVDWITTVDFLSNIRDGDFVLCRTTAPLVKRCLQMIQANRKATVKGRDIGKGLLDLTQQICNNGRTHITDFLNMLRTYKSDRMEKLLALGRETEATAIEDKCDTLEILALACNYVEQIKDRVDSIFSDVLSGGINFCSGHRSKGLEADRIFILRPDLIPHPKCKDGDARIQEDNLKYVMITRAMAELYFVQKEKDER